MTGPTYPRLAPDSNEIGKFKIGSSLIGTIPAFDVWETVLSQYANSDVLMGLVVYFAENVDPSKNLDAFFDLIWNVDTAQGYGLDVWGRIVGINRVVQIPTDSLFFGFKEATDRAGFNQAPFFGGEGLTDNYELADLSYRNLIFAKAFANICYVSIPVLNSMLRMMFPSRGNCYVTDGNPPAVYFGFKESVNNVGFNQGPFYGGQSVPWMTMTYTFEFPLTAVELAIVQNSGVLPKPTGVLATVKQIL